MPFPLLPSELENGISSLVSWLLPMTLGCHGGFLTMKRFHHFPRNLESGPGCAGLDTGNECRVPSLSSTNPSWLDRPASRVAAIPVSLWNVNLCPTSFWKPSVHLCHHPPPQSIYFSGQTFSSPTLEITPIKQSRYFIRHIGISLSLDWFWRERLGPSSVSSPSTTTKPRPMTCHTHTFNTNKAEKLLTCSEDTWRCITI